MNDVYLTATSSEALKTFIFFVEKMNALAYVNGRPIGSKKMISPELRFKVFRNLKSRMR